MRKKETKLSHQHNIKYRNAVFGTAKMTISFTCLYVYAYIFDACSSQLLAVSCTRFTVIMDN